MSCKGTVLITGCSDGGAGSAMVIAFQNQGYRVFATSRSLTTMSKVENIPNVSLLQLDVTRTSDIRAAVDAVSEETKGTLTYLINCAARNHFMPLLDENIEDAKALYDTNVWGPLAVTQAFAPLLIKAKGTVVFITSLSGYLNVPYQGLLTRCQIDATLEGWFNTYNLYVILLSSGYANLFLRHFCCIEEIRGDYGRNFTT